MVEKLFAQGEPMQGGGAADRMALLLITGQQASRMLMDGTDCRLALDKTDAVLRSILRDAGRS